MNIKKLSLAAAVSALTFTTVTNAVLGPIPIYLKPVELTSNNFSGLDTEATFATETYTSKDISESSANNIYDFLNQNTSLSFAPSSGNRFSQKIDMRGYGLTDGYQNIAIYVDGRRINNIDTAIASLSSVAIENIKTIEIIKGSGSVIYGDSATAGVINIITNKTPLKTAKVIRGSYGIEKNYVSVVSNIYKNTTLSAIFQNSKHGGFGDADNSGNKDKGSQSTKQIKVNTSPSDKFDLSFSIENNKIDNFYPSWLTKSQFDSNPTQVRSGVSFNHNITNSNIVNLTSSYDIDKNTSLSFNISKEDKDITTFSKNDYEYLSGSLALNKKINDLTIDTGVSFFNGSRKSSSDTFKKDNKGVYAQATLQANENLIYTFGVRSENVDYAYEPNSGISDYRDHSLESFDIGVNKKINDDITIFSNYNHAFQAPLIDRFFNWNGAYNGDMNPSKSKTINIGLNHLTKKSKTKATLFRSNITNEMYYHSASWTNTNLDKSHKYGLELQNKHQITPKLKTNINYAYTIAKIDEEDKGSGAYNNKYLPMVSKHNITASASYNINNKSKVTLTQKYRSSAFSEEDFANNESQKQKAFNSTNVSYLYEYNKDLEFTFDIENLFKNSYGTWLRDDVIYPGNSTRNISTGLTYKF